MRLIDADTLMPNAEYKGANDFVSAYDIVNAPTIDPVEHGHWEDREVIDEIKSSTAIDQWQVLSYKELYKEWNFYPNCETKADEEQDDETD